MDKERKQKERKAISERKENIRNRIWKLMEDKKIARPPLPPYHRIPNFEDSSRAAENLRKTETWKAARIILANPDSAQMKVRELALKDNKFLIMASPGLRAGYIFIDPIKVEDKRYAATIEGAFRAGERIDKGAMKAIGIDLVITGCVAVDKNGWRTGKGKGWGDREIALCKEINPKVKVATTVHDAQIVDSVPHEEWDQKVDIIATPTKVIEAKK